jgi:hypothetical protein
MQKIRLLLLLIVLLTPFFVIGEWISLDGNHAKKSGPKVTLISDDGNSTVLKIDISGFDLKEFITDGKSYQLTDLLSESFTIKPGFPEVPYIAKVLAIPDQATLSYEILETGITQTFHDIYLPPARESWIEGEQESAYTENERAFNSTKAYPENMVSIEPPSVFRDFRIARISIFPFRYYPAAKKLETISSITIKIKYSEGLGINPKNSQRKPIAPSFGSLYRSFIFNYENVLEKSYGGKEDGHDLMLCIMPDDFEASFQDYADWKRQSGTDIHITKFSDIGANASDETIIKDHIEDAYFNWEIPPTYVLLVGDEGVCPTHGGSIDENYFGEMEGNDYFPELMIGRFTNQSDYGLLVMTNKFKNYETDPYIADTEWFEKGICCSNNAYESQVETKRFAAEQMLDYGFTSVDTMMNSYPCNYDLQDVINAINEGRSYLNYRGEGWSSGWWASCTPMSISDASSLTNGQKLPFVTSIGCGVAMFGGECFGEAWIEGGTISSPKGAAAFMGPTGNTHTTYNNKIDKGIYVGMFQEGMDTPGQAQLRGKLYMYNVFGNDYYVEYHYRIFCLLGDPSIHIWKDIPQEITADYPSSVPLGTNSVEFTITHTSTGLAVENAQVTISDDTYFSTGYTDEQGVALIDMDVLEPKEFTVTVRGGTVIPYQGELFAVVPSGAYVIEDSYAINDAAGGNNNSLMDYGESNLLSLTMENVGIDAAEEVEVTISTNNGFITITDNTEIYDYIPAGTTLTVTDGFAYTVSPSIPDLEQVNFEVTATDASETWTSNFTIEAHAPIIDYIQYAISDPTGNNNGKLDPGETVDLIITIENSGSSTAIDVLGNLFENDPYLLLNSSQTTFGDLEGGAQSNASFNMSADMNTPAGHWVNFMISLEADLGITSSDEFGIIIGQVPVLIIDMDENSNSAPAMEDALNVMNFTYEYTSSIPADLNLYATIFLCLGIFPQNHVLSSSEGQILADYLNFGGSLYMEGGDTWYYDTQTPVHNMFNINGTSDGSSDMGTVVGNTGTFTEDMLFSYSGDNSWIDHIDPVSPAVQIFENQSPNYGTGIAYDAGDYKTIGSSHEFGGLTDGASPSTKADLMTAYLEFLGNFQTLQASFTSNETDICENNIVEYYDLSSGTAISWEWAFEGGSPPTSTNQNPLVAYMEPGIYDVTLTISDGVDMSTISIEDYLTVHEVPGQVPVPIGPVEICATEQTTGYGTTGLPGISVYHWLLEPAEAGNVSGTNLTTIINWESGFMGEATLRVAGENECGLGDYSAPLSITRYLPDVNLDPFEMVCVNYPAFELSGGTPEGGVYTGDGVENGWFDPSIAGLGTHTIAYTYTDGNTCENFATATIYVDPCTGMLEYEGALKVTIYPNPGKGDLTISTDQDSKFLNIEIYNTLNQMVYSSHHIKLFKDTGFQLKLNYLNPGIYYLHLSGNDLEKIEKIIIQE